MDENIDPWDNLKQSAGSLSQIERRADPNHPIDFFRGRSSDGRYLFILKGVENSWDKKFPTLAGIKDSTRTRITRKPAHHIQT